MSTPAQQVLFPLSSISLQSPQNLSLGFSPAFPPLFSSQTCSCKSKGKLQLLHSQSAPKVVLLTFPAALFPGAFSLGWWLLVAWNDILPLLSHCATTGFSELCVSSSTIVPLHNRRAESYISSTVRIPAALPCGTPVVLSSPRDPKHLALHFPVHARPASLKAVSPCSLLFLNK